MGTNDRPAIESTRIDLCNLFDFYYRNLAYRSPLEVKAVVDSCVQLFTRDYPQHVIIDNENGLLSSSYPAKIFIPQRVVDGKECLDTECLSTLISKGRIARCRTRFPVAVILFDNKYVCRSATLSGGAEIYGRTGLDLLFVNSRLSATASNLGSDDPDSSSDSPLFDTNQVFTYARNQDIRLLNYFSVKLICDLMVEYKKVKFWVNVSSSEKADKRDRYEDFSIMLMPYPGCEFFKRIKDKNYKADGVTYDWNQGFVDSKLSIPKDKIPPDMQINWQEYESWDILTLTKNYLRLLLLCLRQSDDSMLIHCISGWDRTPLFISLIRLSLWADGLIHQKLNAEEITYLTLAYDWYLFGHNLSDRISKGEDILFFCFYFLTYIDNEDFCMVDFSTPDEPPDISGCGVSTTSCGQSSDFPFPTGVSETSPTGLDSASGPTFEETTRVSEDHCITSDSTQSSAATTLTTQLDTATVTIQPQELTQSTHTSRGEAESTAASSTLPSSSSPVNLSTTSQLSPTGCKNADELSASSATFSLSAALNFPSMTTSTAGSLIKCDLEDDMDKDSITRFNISGHHASSSSLTSDGSTASRRQSETSDENVGVASNGVQPTSPRSKPMAIPNSHLSNYRGSAVGSDAKSEIAHSNRSDCWIFVSSAGEAPASRILYNSPASSISKEYVTFSSGSDAGGSHNTSSSSGHNCNDSSDLKTGDSADTKDGNTYGDKSSDMHEEEGLAGGVPLTRKERVLRVRKSRLKAIRRYFFAAYSSVVFDAGNKVSPDTMTYLTQHFTGSMSLST